jgi:hypothetical protein
MSTGASKKGKTKDIVIVNKIRDYSNEPAFKKKGEKTTEF